MSFRSIYISASSPELFIDSENLESIFGIPERSTDFVRQISLSQKIEELKNISARKYTLINRAIKDTAPDELQRICSVVLSQTSPLASSMGMPLHGLSTPSVFEDDVNLKILKIHADDVGVGRIHASRFTRYCDLLNENNLTHLASGYSNIGLDRSIRDCFFEIPAMIYSLSRRCDYFRSELLGIDICMRAIGLMPFWKALSNYTDYTTGNWDYFDLSQSQCLHELKDKNLSEYLIDTIKPLLDDKDEFSRIINVIDLYTIKFDIYCDNISKLIEIHKSPRLEMALLIQDKARDGSLYHDDYEIEGRPLRNWLQEARTAPLPLVDALSKSKLISAGKPENSSLFKLSQSVHSKMFRIFSDNELGVIRRWILSLPGGQNKIPNIRSIQYEHDNHLLSSLFLDSPEYKEITTGDLSLGTTPKNIRHAYSLLLGRTLFPKVRKFADNYIKFWLHHSEKSLDMETRSLPKSWKIGKLREWLRSSHEKQGYEFDRNKVNTFPTRETVIDQTLQLAPLTMIDGAWLQGFTEPSLASTDYGAPLFETYWDELGNGDWNINHPKIYRDVLKEMGKNVGAIDSPDFCNHSEIKDESFFLPVFWLAIGKFPVKYTAEILGLNLAMELSGVGGSYRSAQKFLKHYGFPTIFVDLHNSIDNVSTGHSAWAADAIDAYILRARNNQMNVKNIWHRIRTGYESLAPIVDNNSELNYFSRSKVFTLSKKSEPDFYSRHLNNDEGLSL